MVIAVERCLCVLFPLKAQSLMSTRTMAILLFTMTVLVQVGFTLFLFTYRVGRIVNTRTGLTLWILMPASNPNQDLISRAFHVVHNIILAFAMNLIAVAVVFICTVITVIKLKLALTWRSTTANSSNVQTQQTALTKMLVVVCCIFAVCSLPDCVIALVRRFEPEYAPGRKYVNIFSLTHVISHQLFLATNCSVNFFVYYKMSSRFRLEVRRLIVRKRDVGIKGQ